MARLLEDPRTYPIQARYDEFNRLYFKGQLPRVPLSMKALKGKGGVVNFKYVAKTKEHPNGYVDKSSIRLSLSTTYARTHEHLDGLLLHEMIHVYFAAKDDWRESHGIYFEAMRRDLAKASGIVVPRLDTIDELEVAVSKKVGVIVCYPVGPVRPGAPERPVTFFMVSAANAISNPKLRAWATRHTLHYAERVVAYTVSTPAWTKRALNLPETRKFDNPPPKKGERPKPEYRVTRYYLRDADLIADLKSARIEWEKVYKA